MPNIAIVLREEIARLARKEVRAAVEKARKTTVRHQKEIASLKALVKSLEARIAAFEKARAKSSAQPVPGTPAKPTRFVPKGIASMRKRLGLSASDLAGLMGVSSQTIYNWERATTKPSQAQRERLIVLRGMGKRELKRRMTPAGG